MSLVKSPVRTEENHAARENNGRKSRGAATPEGKERARAANLRHGVYSRIRDEALTALGEDPAELAALIEGGYEQWRPANGFQANVVEQLAHLQWRLQRAARMQETLAAEHIKEVDADRREKTMPLRYHYVDKVDFLALLQKDAARPDFFASPGYIGRLTVVFADEMQGRIPEILDLLQRLRKPPNFAPATGRLPAHATKDEDWRLKLEMLEEQAEAAGFEVPPSDLAVAEGAERDELREELRQLAALELETTEAAWKPFFDKYMNPLGQGERDKAAWDVQRTLDLLRRQEDSCFRQFWRLSTLLMKIQDREEKRQDGGANRQDSGFRSQGLGARSEELGARIQESAAASGAEAGMPAKVAQPSHNPRAASKNAGASGDVDENKGKGKTAVVTDGPAPAIAAQTARVPLTNDQTPKQTLDSIPGGLDNARF